MQPEDHRAAIASLSGHLGYKLLLSDIEESFESILANLADASTDEQVVRFGRLFQIFYRMRTLLATTPETFKDSMGDDIDKITKLAPLDPNSLALPPHRAALLEQIESYVENNHE